MTILLIVVDVCLTVSHLQSDGLISLCPYPLMSIYFVIVFLLKSAAAYKLCVDVASS